MSDPAHTETWIGLVTELLDTLVLERRDDGFHRVGAAPPWLRELVPESDAVLPPLPFLEQFASDAESFWDARRDGRLRSGPWTEETHRHASVHLTASALRFGDLCLLLVSRDEESFDEHARLAQRGRDAVLEQQRLARESERKEILVHMIVHDLAVPVNAVLGCLEMLEELELREPIRKLVDAAHRAAIRQDQLVREVLEAFASERDEMSHVEVDPARAPDAVEVAARVRSMLEPVARRFGVRLVLADELPRGPAPVRGEASRLERMLTNLVENAMRHSPSGGVVALEVVDRGDEIEFAVSDEGPGVPPEQVGRLFDKFTQGARRGRAGLGLYFCATTARRWGGSIGYAPRPQGGARFWIRLSRARVGADQSLVDARE